MDLSQRTHYVPEEGTTFAVYGKYREPAAFMKYDTVLPYMFVPNLNAIALSFPLDSTKYYLLLLLPLRDDGVDQLICDLRLYGNLRFILDNLRLTHVEAIIPSFTLKGYVTLTPTLQKVIKYVVMLANRGLRFFFSWGFAKFSNHVNQILVQ